MGAIAPMGRSYISLSPTSNRSGSDLQCTG